jgi:hypothetical protein
MSLLPGTLLSPRWKGLQKFTYIPLIPWLIVFVGNQPLFKQMQYHGHEHKHTPGLTTDMFDGKNYCRLWKQKVELTSKVYDHKYFADDHDIALGLSTDGFIPFKK